MEKQLNKTSDFILYGYVLQGVASLCDWSVVLMWISLGFALVAMVLGLRCAFTNNSEDEKGGKYMKKTIYYVLLSIILVVICLYRVGVLN